MPASVEEILARLPGKDCGQFGYRTCAEFAAFLGEHPDQIERCVHLPRPALRPVPLPEDSQIPWKDLLGRDYDLVLKQFPGDPGPRETILPFNPTNVERLGIKKGDVLYGRPVWVGCPVSHVGVVVEEPDYFNGTLVWCVVGPLAARQGGTEIGSYNPVAYEGLVRQTKTELQVGRRYYFLPRRCMLQSRHSRLASAVARRDDGVRVRMEGIWIG
jgi:uncharacterized Fe-S cluster-containing protein